MKTLGEVYRKLWIKNAKDDLLAAGCNFFACMMISAFGLMMQSKTVQEVLPTGGDSRKMMMFIFAVAVIGCAVFVLYAYGLFFKAKSRQTGVLLALGCGKTQLTRFLAAECALVGACSTALGLLMGAPVTAGIWKLFRLTLVDSKEMVFRIDPRGYLWGALFGLFATLALIALAWRFLKRTNIIDVVNEQRKSEPIRDVKDWYPWAGIMLLVAGAAGGYLKDFVIIKVFHHQPIALLNAIYLLALAGIYLLLLYGVVRGFGRKGHVYRHIISRSMMKFQGRQTVRNMCVVTLLAAAGSFAMFYVPTNATALILNNEAQVFDGELTVRQDEPDPLTEQDIQKLAEQKGIDITRFFTVEKRYLGVDGTEEVWNDDGSITQEYRELYREQAFISQSDYERTTGEHLSIPAGKYILVTQENALYTPEEVAFSKIWEPAGWQEREISQAGVIYQQTFSGMCVLRDEDFAALTDTVPDDWRERLYLFRNEKADRKLEYDFSQELYAQFVQRCTEKSEKIEFYDRVQKHLAAEAGNAYSYDNGVTPGNEILLKDWETGEFKGYWRYMPALKALNRNDLFTNHGVYFMVFLFITLICLAAIAVITYTRAMTIASINERVYDDLKHLGAGHAFLYRSVKHQVSKIFALPLALGGSLMYLFFILILLGNGSDGVISMQERCTLAINGGLLAVCGLLLYGVYRITLKKVCRVAKV